MLIEDNKDKERYYTALVNRDEAFLGLFYVGVKTTGIYCIATCSARKPKFENVEFFSEMRDVVRLGYRPCKVCKPTNTSLSPPDYIQKALNLLSESAEHKISDFQLSETGLSPERIRRWFKKHHKMTFQAYQRMLRLGKAFNEIKVGHKVTNAAYNAGYESLSGFGYTCKKLSGLSPEQLKKKNILYMTRIQTVIGPMYACASDKGICLLEFTDRRMLETELEDLQNRLNAIILYGENEHIKILKKELQAYFDGGLKEFSVELDTPTTRFRQEVWDLLLKLPYGKTASYMDQAKKLGNPKAIRAVATANGHNRIAIVIPCHRIIGSDGSLTGYAGGLERKQWLLDHEARYSGKLQMKLF